MPQSPSLLPPTPQAPSTKPAKPPPQDLTTFTNALHTSLTTNTPFKARVHQADALLTTTPLPSSLTRITPFLPHPLSPLTQIAISTIAISLTSSFAFTASSEYPDAFSQLSKAVCTYMYATVFEMWIPAVKLAREKMSGMEISTEGYWIEDLPLLGLC